MRLSVEKLALGVYEHYLGGFYQVLAVAEDSSNNAAPGSLYVIYISLSGSHLPGLRSRIRQFDEFTDWVVLMPSGNVVPVAPSTPGAQERFKWVGYEIPESAR